MIICCKDTGRRRPAEKKLFSVHPVKLSFRTSIYHIPYTYIQYKSIYQGTQMVKKKNETHSINLQKRNYKHKRKKKLIIVAIFF